MSATPVKTVFGAYIELVRTTPNNYVAPPFSTLNEKFTIQSGVNPAAGIYPEPKYFAIGRGGHRNAVGTGNASLVDILQHDVQDACLFESLPFIMREISNDLSPTDRAKYRLRRLERHNNVDYFVYYLKLIEASTAAPDVETVTISDGSTTKEDYTFSATQLSPTPIIIDPNVATPSSGRHKVVSTPVSAELSNLDTQEIVNAATIIYGDARYATISEVALVAGVDQEVTSNAGSVDATYDESIVATCTDFIGADVNCNASAAGATFDFRLTTSLPHLV